MPALAEAVHLSPSRLSHLFMRETGASPVRYLRTIRMNRAAGLLDQTVLSVKEIMALVGCTDPSHFSRDFRRLHGISPRAYRRRCRSPGQDLEARPAGTPASSGRTVAERFQIDAPAVDEHVADLRGFAE